MQSIIKLGDQVTFNNKYLNDFIAETDNINSETYKYQQLVISGAHLNGRVKKHQGNLTWVTFEHGWELPIPTRYLKLSTI